LVQVNVPMRMPNKVLELIRLNYSSMSPSELNDLFQRNGFSKFRESTIQKKIDILKGTDESKYFERKERKEKALANPLLYRARTLFYSAKKRANDRGIPFNITLDFVIDKLEKGRCESTGLKFKIKEYSERGDKYEKINSRAPSLDQIKPSEGYTKDNVRLVCDHFNKMKNDKSVEETYKVAKAFIKFYKKQIKNTFDNGVKLKS